MKEKNQMKKVALLAVVLLLLASGAALAADAGTIKIGYIDLVKALNESEAGKKAKSDLEFLIKTKQTSIDEKGKAIEKAKSELEKQSSVLSPDARKTKEEEMERLVRDYQRFVTDSQNEVKKRESELTGDILKELRAVAQKIGEEEGYTIILESAESQILYAKKELDLTQGAIKRYNDSKAGSKK